MYKSMLCVCVTSSLAKCWTSIMIRRTRSPKPSLSARTDSLLCSTRSGALWNLIRGQRNPWCAYKNQCLSPVDRASQCVANGVYVFNNDTIIQLVVKPVVPCFLGSKDQGYTCIVLYILHTPSHYKLVNLQQITDYCYSNIVKIYFCCFLRDPGVYLSMNMWSV